MNEADRRESGLEHYQIAHSRGHVFDRKTWRDDFQWIEAADRANLPEDAGVYVLVTYDDIPIYVGSTYTSLRRRLAHHHRQRAFNILGADKIAFRTCSDPDEHRLYAFELDAMRHLLPVLNDRSDCEVAIEFFDGRRRFVPISTDSPIGWNVKWKRSIGRPRRPRPPAAE